jgi:hypothetical protein
VERHRVATTAVRNGDATPLVEMVSSLEPATLFPAAQPSKRGRAQVCRRENGEWKLAHRHADLGPGGNRGVDQLRGVMPPAE